MTTVAFTSNLLRHLKTPTVQAEGVTVRQVLEGYFQVYPQVRGYILDDLGTLRKHVAIFLNRELIDDRIKLSDPTQENDTIYVVQALSGG